MIHCLRTIDAHAAGEPLRLIVDGFPRPEGRTMVAKSRWVARQCDRIRRALLLEPRGHGDMYGAVLTEPGAPHAHSGVLFMHTGGYSPMCGHGIIAVVTIALERGVLVPPDDTGAIVLDTPAGIVRARATVRRVEGDRGELGRSGQAAGPSPTTWRQGMLRVETVAFVNVPAFLFEAGVPVKVGGRTIPVDVAFGGAFYAIVDAEAAGVPLDPGRLPELRRLGQEIRGAVEARLTVAHPYEKALTGIEGTMFTGPATVPGADLRNVTVRADGGVDRSPCGTGTSAVMAVLDQMGVLPRGRDFVHESLIGTTLRGRILGRTNLRDIDAVVTEIEGSAWITGEHTFFVDEDDPLRDGFRI